MASTIWTQIKSGRRSRFFLDAHPEILGLVVRDILDGEELLTFHRADGQSTFDEAIPSTVLELESFLAVSVYEGEQIGEVQIYVTHLAAIPLNNEEIAWIRENPTIRVHNEIDWPPFNFNLDGVPQGYSIDMMELLAEKIGIDVEYVSGPSWNEFLDMMRTGDLDVMLNIVRTPERERYLLYTPPYASNPSTILSRVGSEYRSIQELFEKTVAIPKGFFYEEVLSRDFPRINLLLVDSTLEAMKRVEFGDADAAFGELAVLSHLRRKNFLTNLTVSGEVDLGDPEYNSLNIATRLDLPILAGILSKAVESVTSGERRELEQRWFEGQRRADDREALSVVSELQQKTSMQEAKQGVFRDLILIAAGLGGIMIVLVLVMRRVVRDNPAGLYSSRLLVVVSGAFVVAVMGGTVIATIVALDALEREVRQRVADSLESTLLGRKAHLDLWRDTGVHNLEMLLQSKLFSTEPRASGHAVHHADGGHEHHAHVDGDPFILLDREGGVFISEYQRPDGTPIDWFGDARLDRDDLTPGEIVVVPPLLVRRNEGPTTPVSFAATSLEPSSAGEAQTLLVPMDQSQSLSSVRQAGQLFETGETYAVTESGLMASRSRFEEGLVEIGLIEEPGDEVLRIRVSDPGTNMTENPGAALAPEDRPLTRMAKAVVRGESGIYVEGSGYRDYRGVDVFGAWLWVEELGVGIATEVDVDEALGPFRETRLTLLLLVGGVVFVGLGLAGIAIMTGRGAATSLAKANLELEGRVEERTKEVVASETRVRSIIENTVDGIIVINQSGIIQMFSPAAERIFGYAPGEVLGQNVAMLMPAHLSREHDGYLERYLQTGERRIVGSNREVVG